MSTTWRGYPDWGNLRAEQRALTDRWSTDALSEQAARSRILRSRRDPRGLVRREREVDVSAAPTDGCAPQAEGRPIEHHSARGRAIPTSL